MRWKSMEHLLIQEPFGFLVIGSIGEGNGSGSKDTGNIDSKKFGVMS